MLKVQPFRTVNTLSTNHWLQEKLLVTKVHNLKYSAPGWGKVGKEVNPSHLDIDIHYILSIY